MDFGFIADETFRHSFTAKGFETLLGVVESIAFQELTIYIHKDVSLFPEYSGVMAWEF